MLLIGSAVIFDAVAVPMPFGLRAQVARWLGGTDFELGVAAAPATDAAIHTGILSIVPVNNGSATIQANDTDGISKLIIKNGPNPGTGANALLLIQSTDEIEIAAVTHVQITQGEFIPPFGTTAAEPATCTTGAIYVDTTIPVMKVCSPDDTWTP